SDATTLVRSQDPGTALGFPLSVRNQIHVWALAGIRSGVSEEEWNRTGAAIESRLWIQSASAGMAGKYEMNLAAQAVRAATPPGPGARTDQQTQELEIASFIMGYKPEFRQGVATVLAQWLAGPDVPW
ncbi:MAG TPA: hypothetical protein VIZ43_16960, partial [Trebonia sp.]